MTALTWRRADEYHFRSQCGRFSIARVIVSEWIWYIAWRLTRREDESSTEIGATRLPLAATPDERKAALIDMQQICEAEA
jgi:hypothetical protein